MNLVTAANRAAAKNKFYRQHGILIVPADKLPYNNIQAMWKAGWRVVLTHVSTRGKLHYCYKPRGIVIRMIIRLLSYFQ